MSREKIPGLAPEAEREVLARLERMDRRLRAVEVTPPVDQALISSDFVAREGQTLYLAAPAAGISGLLPAPTPRNRGARITLVFTTEGPVMLTCQGGTVNGSATLTHTVIGAYTAVSDGTAGWWLQSLELAEHLRGTGLTVTSTGKLTLRQRPRLPQLQDYFASGNTTSGSIGALGWNLLGSVGGSYTRLNPTTFGSTNRGALTTTALINSRACLTLGETEARAVVDPATCQILQCAWNMNNSLSTKRVFFGLNDNFANDPAAAVNCLGVYYDSAVDTHYQIIARSGSAGSPTVTTRTVPASTAELMTIWQNPVGTFSFYFNGTLLGSISSGVPTAAMNVGFRVETLAVATAKVVNVGYFGLEASVATNSSFDDDAFLEL